MERIIKLLKICPLIVFISLAVHAGPAETGFVVFYNSGKAVKLSSAGSPVLKKGDRLTTEDKIRLPRGTQLVLVCSNYSAIQLNAAGEYPVKSLLPQCTGRTSSLTSAYFKYIWEQFSHHHASPEQEPVSYMKTAGAVSRGSGAALLKLSPDTINYFSGRLVLFPLSQAANLSIFLYNKPSGGTSLLKQGPVKSIRIDSLVRHINTPGYYYLQLPDAARRCFLRLWEKEEYEREVRAIIDSIPEAGTAEKAYLTGYVLEERHFLAEAGKYYAAALKLEPGNKNYQTAYSRFYE